MEIRIAPKPLVAMKPAAVTTALSVSGAPTPAPGTGGSMLRKETVLPPRRQNRKRRLQAALTAATAANSIVPSDKRSSSLAAVTSPLTIYQPSSGLPLRQSEGMYFHLFRMHTASQLSGYFNSNFWTQRVLQQCHSEAAIRHAVVALGALYKTLDESFEPASSHALATQNRYDSIMHHWQVAIKQYSDACNAMLSVNGDHAQGNRTRLMATILLACFDSFIGDHKQAIFQIQTGLGLLEQFRSQPSARGYSSSPSVSASPSDEQVPDDLIVLFNRLAIQAKSYDMAFHFPQPYIIRLTTPNGAIRGESPSSDRSSPAPNDSPLASGQFDNLFEARLAADRLCKALLVFIEKLQTAKSDPSNVLPASWKQYGMGLKERIDAWLEAFEPIFLSRQDPGISHIESLGISALKMFMINTNIIFLMMFCDNEVQFDSFTPHFKTIVALGWEVVGTDQRRAEAKRQEGNIGGMHEHHETNKNTIAPEPNQFRPHVKPSFSADLGIVPPLFVVATKCRDPWLRRQAIQLLKSSARREGMWDSELAANIGTWVMNVEEFDPKHPEAVLPSPPSPNSVYSESIGTPLHSIIPEERRVMVKTVDFDLRGRTADMTVGTRALYNGSQDVRFRQTQISW